ncbi:sigma-70 family RNA polymerase sigma factor [Bailinhaonella thermotolerans]|uniref:Sigma-70 family RNA polymerase sigma factor n=1 Tax=Bailinhaonella thermotolerans TaxID=1070861 RepID=A0A3A4ARR0_9ACTN|nr:sigma-70 family RNA polymerase sigma factor [Bailinhaonella thermotolerans]RJL23978.1 sigma-70 family RNA polymerase sigma factor [Bailinhaonella thermotolerans]
MQEFVNEGRFADGGVLAGEGLASGDDRGVDTVDPQMKDYRGQNVELFGRRKRLSRRLAQLRARADAGDLDYEEEVELARLGREFEDLTYEIMVSNYGLVKSYVARFTSKSTANADDYESAGRVGLLRAIDTYDPSKGPFGQWAFKPIQREVLKAVRDAEHPNVNMTDFEKRPKILRAAADFLRDHGDGVPLDYDDIAARAEVPVGQVRRVLEAPRLDSLSAPLAAAEGDMSLADRIADAGPGVEDQVLRAFDMRAVTVRGLPHLEPRELFVLARRFSLDGEPAQPLRVIGEMLGLSREGVRQIQAKALAKLNHPVILGLLVSEETPRPAAAEESRDRPAA